MAIISTYFAGSYDLAANDTSLTITASGGVGGGVTTEANSTTVVNFGRLRGQYALSSNYFITLFNEPGATISGGSYGVRSDGVAVINRGLIHGGRYGVRSTVGGTVANGAATYTNAQISGYTGGITLSGGVSTVTNFGTVTANSGYAVFAYGSVTNGSGGVDTALISGAGGVQSYLITSLANFGTIRGSTQGGVELEHGGSVTNGSVSDTEALIAGYTYGVFSINAVAATVSNFGTIRSTSAAAFGILLTYGGTVTNGALTDTAAIIEGYGGVAASDAAGTVNNLGSIVGQGAGATGVSLFFGGAVNNGAPTDRGAMITGFSGVAVGGGATPSAVANITNAGTIRGDGDATSGGVVDRFNGAITLINGSVNDSTALIEGYTGVALTNASLLTNFGSIIGEGATGGPGVYLAGAGPIRMTNGAAGHAGALIDAAIGVYAFSAGETVTNFGTIIGLGGTAVHLLSATDVLAVEAGSTFIGAVLGGGGTLELGSGVGTLTGLLAGGSVTVSGSMATTTFNNFESVQIDSGASFTLAGTGGTIGAGQALTVLGTLAGTGTLALTGGTATFGTGANLAIAKVTEAAGSTASFTTNLSISDLWAQTGGTVTVTTGDRINFLAGGNSFGGTLTGAGVIAFLGGTDALTGTTLSASNVLVSGGAVTLSGAINLSKTLTVTSPNLTIAAAGATLSGGGALYLNTAATSAVIGATSAATLTNKEVIEGAGQLGDGQLTIVNAAGGVIAGFLTTSLTINTGAGSLSNAGLIENTNTGGTTITGAVSNTGTLLVSKGILTVDGAVTGAGRVVISGGVADFASTLTENVIFTGTTGVLELAKSQTYTGQVSGLSASAGGSTLDLLDVSFTSGTTKATYSGTTASGTLTVTDGTHTAKITLIGNYVGHSFTTASDGHGGTTVSDPAPSGTGHVTPLVTAMAGFGANGGASAAPTGFAHRHEFAALARPA